MKKEITIPEEIIEVETKFYASSIASASAMNNIYSPNFDTYDEAMRWIASHLWQFKGGTRVFEIKAIHGRFENSE